MAHLDGREQGGPRLPFTVKICGVRTLASAQAAVDSGADSLGFICFPAARRFVPPERIAAILAGLVGRDNIRAVGVFVNQSPAEINDVADRAGLDAVQLAGDETVDDLRRLRRPVTKALRPAGAAQSRAFDAWWDAASDGMAHGLQLESPQGGWGGAGAPTEWSVARAFTARTPRPRLTLAGGLHAGNVAAAIAAVQPDGVDVSSGVETDGQHDLARIAAFLAAARGATR